MIAQRDFVYCGLPWKTGGRTREGLDCAGLAMLFLREELGIELPQVDTTDRAKVDVETALKDCPVCPSLTEMERGDLMFFRDTRTGRICHVATFLGDGRFLHITKLSESYIANGMKLFHRIGLRPATVIKSSDVERVAQALHDPRILGEGVGFIIMLAISLALSAASYLLAPKLARFGNKYGRYGFDALVTQNSPEVPLPDLLGTVTVAGNSPYTQQAEKGGSATASAQKANKIVILASAPSESIDYQTGLKINGLAWNDTYFKNGTEAQGFCINPAQTKDEAVTGSIGADSNVPSVSLYTGAYGVSVPVDVRAQYDRDFPIYGFSGCTYLVFRLIDSSKFQNFNVTTRVKCRKCRTFDANGFVTATVTGEALTGANAYTSQAVTAASGTERLSLTAHALQDGDQVFLGGTAVPGGTVAGVYYYLVNSATNDFQLSLQPGGSAINLTSNGTAVTITSRGKTRFKLAHEDIASVSSVTINGVSNSAYHLNRTKGFIEFYTAPAAGATILITYTYYVREWSQNPAMHLVYMLTEVRRGKGFGAHRINWPAAVAKRDYDDEVITWQSSTGPVTGPRFQTAYAIDFRKPIQEHIQAILDGSHSVLYVSGGKWVMRSIRDEASVMSFNTSNILVEEGRSTFTSHLLDRSTRANRINVFYHSEETLNAETGVPVDHEDDQAAREPRMGNGGVADANLKLSAVTSPSQAERLAHTHLEEEVSARHQVRYKTNIRGLALEPCDVVDVTHPSQASWVQKKVRIDALEHDADDRLEIVATEYTPGAYV